MNNSNQDNFSDILASFESSLLKPSIEVSTSLHNYQKQVMKTQSLDDGYIFTAYSKLLNQICIGYEQDLECLRNKCSAIGFEIIAIQPGRSSRMKMTVETLSEIGFQMTNTYGLYRCTNTLINYLVTLLWPLGKLDNKNISKRKKYLRKYIIP